MAAPTIANQPLDRTAAAGTSVTLHAVFGGDVADYQWVRVLDLANSPTALVDGALYSGSTTATLTLPNFSAAQVGLYGLIGSNQDGTASTKLVAVLLNGMVLPAILAPPADLTVNFGDTATLTVTVKDDAGPYTYSWYKDGQPIGQYAATMTISGVTTHAAGFYQVRVDNATGAVLSAAAGLSVQSGGQTVQPQGYAPLGSVVALNPPAGGVQLGAPDTGGGSAGTGTGGSGASAGSGAVSFSLFANNLGTQGKEFYLDGNYSAAFPVGLAIPTFPFLDQNNTNAVVFRQPHEQAIGSYTPLSMTDPQPALGGLYYFGDANFKDTGAGVYGFDRLFGNIPSQRVRRGQSYNYTFQGILVNGASISSDDDGNTSYTGPTYSIGTEVYSIDSTEIRDYFLDGQQSQYPLRRAPCLEMMGQTIVEKGEDFNNPGTFPLVVGPDGLMVGAAGITQILAQDDRYEDYRGAVKCRVRRIVAAPTLASFRNSSG